MEPGTIAQWGSALISLLSLTVAVIAVISSSRKGWEEKIAKVAENLKEHVEQTSGLNDRVTKLERDIEHLPDNAVTHRLELALSELRSDVAVMTERLKPVAAISDRLQEFLLEQARGSK
jgi:septal ring factor EnvC (AmiA/AmiB activator)